MGQGAGFSKLPVITGPVKLFCFPFQMGFSKFLKINSFQLKKQSGLHKKSISKYHTGPVNLPGLHHERISLNNSRKLDGLYCSYKGILCEIEEGAKIVNTRHALQIILLLFHFYISLPSSLPFRARSNSLLGSTSCYLVVFS